MNSFTKLSLALAVMAAATGPALAQTARPSQYPDLTTGEAIYKNVCQGCHMPDAKGRDWRGRLPGAGRATRSWLRRATRSWSS